MNPNYWLDRTSQSLDRHGIACCAAVSRARRQLSTTTRWRASSARCAATRPSSTTCSSSVSSRAAWSSADALDAAAYVAARGDPLRLPQSDGDSAIQLAARDLAWASWSSGSASRGPGHRRRRCGRFFRRAEPADDTEVYAERDTYVRTAPSGYAAEHAQIFDPIERAYALLARAQRADRATRGCLDGSTRSLTRACSSSNLGPGFAGFPHFGASARLNRGATKSTSESRRRATAGDRAHRTADRATAAGRGG